MDKKALNNLSAILIPSGNEMKTIRNLDARELATMGSMVIIKENLDDTSSEQTYLIWKGNPLGSIQSSGFNIDINSGLINKTIDVIVDPFSETGKIWQNIAFEMLEEDWTVKLIPLKWYASNLKNKK